MTVQQTAEYIQAQGAEKVERFKDSAVLLHVQALQISSAVAGLMNRKAKYFELEKAYPQLFQRKKAKHADISNLEPEQIRQLEATAWRAFLGV